MRCGVSVPQCYKKKKKKRKRKKDVVTGSVWTKSLDMTTYNIISSV